MGLRQELKERGRARERDARLDRQAARRIWVLEQCLKAAAQGKPAPLFVGRDEAEALISEFPGLEIEFNGEVLR